MLSLQTITNLEGLLLSKRITLGGDEVLLYASMVSELQAEKRRLLSAERVFPITASKDMKIVESTVPSKEAAEG